MCACVLVLVWECRCVPGCVRMPLLASHFLLAKLRLSTQPGNSSSRWLVKSFTLRTVKSSLVPRTSESLSCIMFFFHTTSVLAETKRPYLVQKICFFKCISILLMCIHSPSLVLCLVLYSSSFVILTELPN